MNRWVYANPSGSAYDGGLLLSGPKNTSGLGNETGMIENFVAVGQSTDHLQPGTIFNSGSITQVTGSLFVTAGVTGSFTGSFTGDGAGLTNIPAAGIVGLNLSQISSGSVSASIDPVNGLRINTNVTATSFTGSFSGSFTGTGSYALTASVSVSSSYAETSSYSQLSATASYYAETDPVFVSVSGSFATTASFNAFTSSYNTGSFTGSYTGDGSGLYNIPATGIVGLNLSQIASGSATASISPDTGFQINTNTIITGSLTVTSGVTASLFGTASWATNSVTSSFANNAATASYLLGGVTSASFASTFSIR